MRYEVCLLCILSVFAVSGWAILYFMWVMSSGACLHHQVHLGYSVTVYSRATMEGSIYLYIYILVIRQLFLSGGQHARFIRVGIVTRSVRTY